MPRNYRVKLEDMLEAARKIVKYVGTLPEKKFYADSKTFDAVVRNLEIIGEAAKSIPCDIKDQNLDIEWRKIACLRDILIHEYFGGLSASMDERRFTAHDILITNH